MFWPLSADVTGIVRSTDGPILLSKQGTGGFFFCVFFFNFELNFFFNGNKELPCATYLRSVSSPNLTSESIGVCINLLSAKCIRGLVASQYLKFFPYPPYKLYNTASGDDCCFVTVLSVWRQA